MENKCLVCGRKLRGLFFPFNLFFWKRKATVYSFISEAYGDGEIYDIRAIMCYPDKEWANKNPVVAQMLLKSKISAVRKRDENE